MVVPKLRLAADAQKDYMFVQNPDARNRIRFSTTFEAEVPARRLWGRPRRQRRPLLPLRLLLRLLAILSSLPLSIPGVKADFLLVFILMALIVLMIAEILVMAVLFRASFLRVPQVIFANLVFLMAAPTLWRPWQIQILNCKRAKIVNFSQKRERGRLMSLFVMTPR